MTEIDYGLNNLIKQYGGIKRIFKSLDFILASICAFFFLIYVILTRIDLCNLIKTLSSDLLNVSASLFAILFAAFTIIISLADEKFMKFLRRHNVFNKILLPFWLVSVLYIVDIILNILIKFFPPSIAKYLMALSILVFSWALFGTIYLVSDTIGFARRRADYLEYENEITEILNEEKGKE